MTLSSLKRTLLLCGGSAFGITAYYYPRNNHHLHHYRAVCESNKDTKTNNTVDSSDDELLPSFRSLLFYKILNFDFHELHRPEVLIELLLIGCPLIIGGLTSIAVYSRSSKALKHRLFYNSINITLNTITRNPSVRRGGLKHYNIYFRTLMEKQANEIIPNEEGIKLLINGAKRTNTDEPFIEIDDEYTHWTICNYIANQISSLSSAAFLHRDILSQNNVISEAYLMVLASEPATKAMNKKIRVHLVKKRVIEQLIKDCEFYKENDDGIDTEWSEKLNNTYFTYRWIIIGRIVDIYKQQMAENEGKLKWGAPLCEIELSTPIFCKYCMNDNRIHSDHEFDAIMEYQGGNMLDGWNRGCVLPPKTY